MKSHSISRASVVEDRDRWYADEEDLSRELCQDYENTDDQDAILDVSSIEMV